MIDISPEDKAMLELGELFQQHGKHPAVQALLKYADEQVDMALSQRNPSLEWNMGYAAAMRALTRYPAGCIYNMDTLLKMRQESETEKASFAGRRTAPQTV